MSATLVTVICLCHNQKDYVLEALRSVLNQTHQRVQLIVVDDASTDGSKEVIQEFISNHKETVHIDLFENLGSCKAFNRALPFATGEYIIDLAADDILLPNRIEIGLKDFAKASSKAGVHFSDAELIDAVGNHLSYHSDRFPHISIPQGDIYKEVIQRYFICSPTMLFKKEVIDSLGGYDEHLSYEDFDFWIRSSRSYEYIYSSEILLKRRVLKNSLVSKQFTLRSPHQQSTYRICEKILLLNQNAEEKNALQKRILYEIKLNFRLLNWGLCWKYALLLRKNNKIKHLK